MMMIRMIRKEGIIMVKTILRPLMVNSGDSIFVTPGLRYSQNTLKEALVSEATYLCLRVLRTAC